MQDIIKDIKRTSEVIRRCQRNWNHSKSIPREHIELLADVAKNSPAKQDEAYFDVYAITDSKLIEKLYENSDGFTAGVLNADKNGKLGKFTVWPNSQTRANLVFCWVSRRPTTMRNFYQDDIDHDHFIPAETDVAGADKTPGTPKDPNEWSRNIENTYTSIGISTACVAMAAARLGYVTGYNKNCGEFDEIIELRTSENVWLRYTLGIGFPNEDKPHYVDDEGREFGSFSLTTERENKIVEVTYDEHGNIKKDKLA
jgi:hypothetical protein